MRKDSMDAPNLKEYGIIAGVIAAYCFTIWVQAYVMQLFTHVVSQIKPGIGRCVGVVLLCNIAGRLLVLPRVIYYMPDIKLAGTHPVAFIVASCAALVFFSSLFLGFVVKISLKQSDGYTFLSYDEGFLISLIVGIFQILFVIDWLLLVAAYTSKPVVFFGVKILLPP